MRFLNLAQLLLEGTPTTIKFWDGWKNTYRSGLYCPNENTFIECVFTGHKTLFGALRDGTCKEEKIPDNVCKILTKYFDKFKASFANEKEYNDFLYHNDYVECFKRMGLIRYSIEKYDLSMSCYPYYMQYLLPVFEKIQQEVDTISYYRIDMSDQNNDTYISQELDSETFMPSSIYDLQKLHRANTSRTTI
jgi:hypothetical protein